MQKTVKLSSKQSVKLDNRFSWQLIYYNQFHTDITALLIPVVKAIVEVYGEIAQLAGDGKSARELLAAIPAEQWQNAIIELSGLSIMDAVRITWAMAKAADDTIDEPEIWARNLDAFPLDTVLPVILDMAGRSLVTEKNWKSLRGSLTSSGTGA